MLKSVTLGLLAMGVVVGCGGSTQNNSTEKNGTGPGPGGIARPPHQTSKLGTISERAFTVKAHITMDEKLSKLDSECADFELTARFRPVGAGWIFEVGSEQQLAQANVREQSPGSYVGVAPTDQPYEQPVLVLPGACGRRIELGELTFAGGDANANGAFETFSAKGSGELWTSCGDCAYQDPVHLVLEGAPDVDAPTLELPSAALHPLEASSAVANEALAELQASLTLRGGDELQLDTRAAEGKPLWLVKIPPLLSWGGRFAWRAQGSDWAGNALASTGELRTLDDPGVLPDDGFESAVPALSQGAQPLDVPKLGDAPPQLVTEDAISGTHSLLIDGTQRVTFHLHRAGARKLALSAQQLQIDAPGPDERVVPHPLRVSYGTVGGTHVLVRELVSKPDDIARGARPPLEQLELELADAGNDVIVTFETVPQDEDCYFQLCEDVPVLIDDVRLE